MEQNFVTLMIVILAVAVILSVTAMILLRKKKESPVSQSAQTHQPQNTNKVDEIKVELLSINISVRESIQSKELVNAFEEVIDLVQEVAVPANDPNKYSTQTVIINRMSTNYIPTILKNFLSVPNDVKNEEATLKILSTVKEQLLAVKASYETESTEAFERNTRIMETIFESYTAKTVGENQ